MKYFLLRSVTLYIEGGNSSCWLRLPQLEGGQWHTKIPKLHILGFTLQIRIWF